MQTLERATALLRGASSLDAVGPIFRELGFPLDSFPLDAGARDALDLPPTIIAARITRGSGSLRGLSLELHSSSTVRETLSEVARALARQAPQLLWIVVAIQESTREVAVICWSAAAPLRIVSLLCQQDRIVESDTATLCALAAAAGSSDLLTHSRWLDILGREAITRRFFRALGSSVEQLGDSLSGRISRVERRELALLYVSRLIFLSFLETKGWLDGDFGFLSNGYTRCMETGGHYQRKVLEPLFFGTLNTRASVRSARARSFGRIPFLNGGLFSRSYLEKRRRVCVFSDESFGNAYGSLLSRYRFTGREDSSEWSEASIDPEMLGKAFESLMAADARKTSGAFYTPQALVDELTAHALSSAFDAGEVTLEQLRRVRVLDPACGSGAFLVHILERLAELRIGAGEAASLGEARRRVLMSSIFGVDLSPMAVWLCELRLWLSIVVENAEADPMRVTPLPNLDRHIRVGDSLMGGGFGIATGTAAGKRLTALRNRYTRAIGPRKRTLARALDREERTAAIEVLRRHCVRLAAERKELLVSSRARDLFGERQPVDRDRKNRLKTIRSEIREARQREANLHGGAALPFSFSAHFSDVAAAGGFDIIVGNPPWVRLHEIAESSRHKLKCAFVVYRNAAWETGAVAAGAGRGFAAQIDMAALFIERSCGLLRAGGTLGLLVPAKLWRSLAGGGVRQFLFGLTDLLLIEDLSASSPQFDAAVYPSLLVCRARCDSGKPPAPDSPGLTRVGAVQVDARVSVAVRQRDGAARWNCSAASLALDNSPGSPWLLIPPKVRAAFNRLTAAGIPFAQTAFGRPLLGAKTGLNRAYIVRVECIDGRIATISCGDRAGTIEREMLRPLVRGENIGAWRTTGEHEHVVWPHAENNHPLRVLPPLTRRWLQPLHGELSLRSDLHGTFPWWSVFRVEGASHDLPRVVWADFGLTPRAIVIEAGNPVVALNSCYVARCPTLADANALAALLNGPLVAAWLNIIAEPARGGYRRYLGWTMALLPLPADWERARSQLAPIGERAISDDLPSSAELLDAALSAYGLTMSDFQHLLSWPLGSA